MSTIERRLAPYAERETLVYGAAVLNAEVLLVLAYVALVGPQVTRPLFYVYPFVWINAALYALWRTDLPAAPTRRRLAAGAVALAYLGVLSYVGGLFGFGAGGAVTGLRLELAALPPGWSPALIYAGASLQFALLPFKLFGYLVLAYLLYATLLDAAAGLLGGALGLFSCVSCTLPVIAGVVSGFVGGAGVAAAAAYGQSYALSTVVFVLTVALLLWRPTVADLRGLAARLGG
ncbi:MAG: hypothetical protein V5A62_05265 [Haloarculaceae archaeon]